MYDPKFEKGVRQKMEGLEFAPPDTVWANIEKAVAGRRRRPGFYLWRFALPSLLLVGAVSVVFLTGTPTHVDPTAPAVTPAAADASSAASAAPVATSSQRVPALPGSPFVLPAKPPSGQKMLAFDNDVVIDLPIVNAGKGSKPIRAVSTNNNHYTNQSETNIIDATSTLHTNETSTLNANATTTLIAPYLYQPALIGQGSSAAIKAARVTAKTTSIALNTLQKKKRPWEAGFEAGGGLSRLNRLNVNTGSAALSTSLYNITTASYSAASAPSKSYVSDIRPDASFEGGIYLQKPLSDRWTLNLGMNLHYYSTRITIGAPVNTYVPGYASLVSPTVTLNAQTATAFIAGDRQVFTNHYYFLELPVNIQYTLLKSRMLPVFLQGGVSLSRLVGADALFYNTHSGVYYKDPNVLQKTQVNVASALMVGLPFHGIRVELGPQVQYGLTPLINNHNQGDQHFLYTGIRLVVIPGKK